MSHSPAGNSQLPLFLLLILAATSCGESRPKQGDGAYASPAEAVDAGVVPKDLVPVAITSAKNDCESGSECKDHKIKPDPGGDYATFALEVTDADRANGIEDKWCVVVSYLKRRGGADPWVDRRSSGVYTKRNGVWQYMSRGTISCSAAGLPGFGNEILGVRVHELRS